MKRTGSLAMVPLFSLLFAWARLRRPSPLQELSQLDDPERFIALAFQASARNLAVAGALLPAPLRREGELAFLCCRALDAHEDLGDDDAATRVRRAAAFLVGSSSIAPKAPVHRGESESDALECLIASRLPWLRAGVDALPEARRDAVRALVDDVAQAMAEPSSRVARRSPTGRSPTGRSPTDLATYGERVLGRVAAYGFELIGVALPKTVSVAPVGRAAQAVNHMRDLARDLVDVEAADLDAERLKLWLELAESALLVAPALARVPFPVFSRARAAVSYMMMTTARTALIKLGVVRPTFGRWPLTSALLAGVSGWCFARQFRALDATVVDALFADVGARSPLVARGLDPSRDRLETAIAERHADPSAAIALTHGCRLMRVALLLTADFPDVKIGAHGVDAALGRRLMLADYLTASATAHVGKVGLTQLAAFSRTCARLAEGMQETRDPSDPKGLLLDFLVEAVDASRVAQESDGREDAGESALFRAPDAREEASEALFRAPLPRLRRVERWLEDTLGLEHGANVFPLAHTALFYATFATLLSGLLPMWLQVPLWVGLVLLNYSLSIGVMHLHAHRKLFVRPFANRVLEFLLALPIGLSYPLMLYVHVHLHHRFNDEEGDPTSTKGRERGLAALWYWVRYPLVCHRAVVKGLFAKDAAPPWRRLRGQYVVDSGAVLVVLVVFGLMNLRAMVLLYLLPMLIVSFNIGYFAWLTHAPAGTGDVDGSVNTTNNWMNLFIHNQGFHAVHHRYPGVHWTMLPDRLQMMTSVDDALIVPYWVTLQSAVRLVVPERFRDAAHGRRWKTALRRRVQARQHRNPVLPYFGWIR